MSDEVLEADQANVTRDGIAEATASANSSGVTPHRSPPPPRPIRKKAMFRALKRGECIIYANPISAADQDFLKTQKWNNNTILFSTMVSPTRIYIIWNKYADSYLGLSYE